MVALGWAQLGGGLGWAGLILAGLAHAHVSVVGWYVGWFMMASSGMAEASPHMAILRFQEQQGRDCSVCSHF